MEHRLKLHDCALQQHKLSSLHDMGLAKRLRCPDGHTEMVLQISHQLDDLLNHVGGHWADIGAVCCARICHDCGLQHA